MVLPLSHKCFSFCFLFLFFCCTRKPWDNLAEEYSILSMLHTQCQSLFLNITRVRFQHFFHVKYQLSILRSELKCQRIAVFIAGEGHQEDVTASLIHKLDRLEFPHFLPSDWTVHSACLAHAGSCSRTQPWDSNVAMRPSGLATWQNPVKICIGDWTQLKPLHKLL